MLGKKIGCVGLVLGMLLGVVPAFGQEGAPEEMVDPAVSEPELPVEEYIEEEPLPEEIPPEEPPPPVIPTVRPRPAVPSRPPTRAITPPPAPRASQQPRLRPQMNGIEDGALPGEKISFDFEDVPLYEVIQQISALTGRNFDVDPNISGQTVTLITHDEIPPELAFEVLEAILAARGFSLVETVGGNIIRIVPTPDAPGTAKVPLFEGYASLPEGFDAYSTHIVPVQYAKAAELVEALRLVASQSAQIDAYAPTNTLVITDTADGLRRIFSLLEAIDIPGGETQMEIFTLEYTRAEVLAQQLEQVLLEGAEGGMGQQAIPTRPQPAQRVRSQRQNIPGVAGPQVIGTREEVLRMVPDERLNALIVVASPGMMEQVRDLVKRLDAPVDTETNNLHIYELLNADAEAVETALQPLLGTAPRRQQAEGGGAVAAGPAGGGSAVGRSEATPFKQPLQVSRYDQTNSLLIVASPQDYRVLEAFIARLDVPPRQVYVEAVVMDVTITNDYGLTVDAAGITGNDGFGMTSTALISQLAEAAATAEALAGSGGAAAVGFAQGLLGLGRGGGLTAGIFDDIEFEFNGQKVSIPFVPVLFQAIEKLTDVEVLSQPSMMSLDNEEAEFVVGQEVPFITQTRRGLAGGDDGDDVVNPSYGYTQVQREEVGVKLKVKPQISEGDNVLLELTLEVSDTDATQIGTVDILGPTTNKSEFTNLLSVKDGATAVVAGLIKDNATRDRTQAPLLGDLPVLGWLFKSKTNRHEKRNMVVLITPHIVKENIDQDRVTTFKLGEYNDQNIEMLQDDGFFEKIIRKQEQRKGYRPTQRRSEALTGRRDTKFGRGDINR